MVGGERISQAPASPDYGRIETELTEGGQTPNVDPVVGERSEPDYDNIKIDENGENLNGMAGVEGVGDEPAGTEPNPEPVVEPDAGDSPEQEPSKPRSVDEVAEKLELAARMRSYGANEVERRSVKRMAEQDVWRQQAAARQEQGEEQSEKPGILKRFISQITQKEMRDERKEIAHREDALLQALGVAANKKLKAQREKLAQKTGEEVELTDYSEQVAGEMARLKMAREQMVDDYGQNSDENVMLRGARVDEKGRELSKGETLEQADAEITAEMREEIFRQVHALQHLEKGETREQVRERLEAELKAKMTDWKARLVKDGGVMYMDDAEFKEMVDESAKLFLTDADAKADAEESGNKELRDFLEENFQLTVGRNVQLEETQSNIDTRTGKLGNWTQKLMGTFGIPTSGGKAAMVAALAGPGGVRMAARFGVGAIAGAVLGMPVGAVVGAGAGIATGVAFGRQRGIRRAEKQMIQGEVMHESEKMSDLTSEMQLYIGENGEVTAENKVRAERLLTYVMGLRQLNEREGYAVLVANAEANEFAGYNRGELYAAMGELEAALRGDKDAKEFHQELVDKVDEQYLANLKERMGITEADRVVRTKRKTAGRMGATVSAITGAVMATVGAEVGHVASENMTNFLQNDSGVLGNTWRGLTAALANGEISGSGPNAAAEIQDRVSEELTGNLHEASITPDAEGNYTITALGEDGNDYAVAETKISFAADNTMLESSREGLEAEGFTVNAVENWDDVSYVHRGNETVADYLAEGHENIQQLSGRSWDHQGVDTSGWHVGEGEDTGYYVMHVNDAPEGAEYAISLNKDVQASVVTYPVDADGNVRIAIDDPVASTFTASGRGSELEFGAAYGEVMTVGEDGAAMVYHTDVGGEGVTSLQMTEKVPSYQYVLERGGQNWVISSPESVSHAVGEMETLTSTEGLPQAEVINASTGEAGRVVVKPDVEIDPTQEVGQAELYHFGQSTYSPELSESEMASNTFSQMLANDAEKELVAEALGMEPGASRDEVAAELTRQFSGAELDITDLSQTPNSMTSYYYDGHVLPQEAGPSLNNGHALEARRDGRWLLDSPKLRDFFGIPHDAAGHFAVRLDCGGQIVFIPDATTPEIMPDVTETVVPPTSTTPPGPTPEPEDVTPGPEPEPEPQPEPQPEPRPEPTPEPTPEEPSVVPKGENTNAGSDADQQPITPAPVAEETYVEAPASNTPEAATERVTGTGEALAEARTPEQATATPNSAPSDTTVTDLTDEDLANVHNANEGRQ